MTKKEQLLKLIPEQGILPLYFYKDTEVSIEILRVLYQAGIRTVEYTNRGEAALKNFETMRQLCDTEFKGMFLGVGTIKDKKMAQDFINVGADYIVSPGLIDEVAEIANQHDMLWVPGCMTPSEIIKAESLGAQFVKLFPGNVLGPGFMSAIKELFPKLLFMPTGGVDLNEANISGWFKAGVSAVGMGSKLITKEILEQKKYEELHQNTLQVLALIKACR
ncbi:MAG: bifunctional 4-hydroxy-2-oxoglutarate aldolase/2-dehydro-3-deoxy-phosphogluconate aldolase [Sphingobacteriaceae bacterium]